MRHHPASPATTCILLALLAAASPSPAPAAGRGRGGNPAAAAAGQRLERSAPVMDGVLRIAAAARGGPPDTVQVSGALDLAFAEAARLADVLAPGGGAGELARLNGGAGERRFECSPDLYVALEAAVAMAGATDGAYDPTCGPLLRAWEPRGGARAPEPADLAAARLLTGWRMLTLDPDTRTARFTRPGMEVVLDAVAHGYVLERAARQLRDRGVVRARLELGGDVLAFTNHDAWSATIADPADDARPALTLTVANAAVASARGDRTGDARVVDPRTGQPPPAGAAVTVVARSALGAHALAEALLVMGRESAASYARTHPDTGVLWLEAGTDGVRAWPWNLARLTPEPGARVEWMSEP